VLVDGSELGLEEEISICHTLNPALFRLSMGPIVWVRADTVIPLGRVPIPLIDFALFVMLFCGVFDVKVVVKVRLLLKI
jgi:hypothetical protein